MNKNDLTPEQADAVRRVQSTMAIEGYELTEAVVAAALSEYFRRDEDGLIGQLIETARREGRSEREVFREHYGSPSANTARK